MEVFKINMSSTKWAVIVLRNTKDEKTPYIEFYKTRKECRKFIRVCKNFNWDGYLCKVHTREDGSIFFEKSH